MLFLQLLPSIQSIFYVQIKQVPETQGKNIEIILGLHFGDCVKVYVQEHLLVHAARDAVQL